MKNTLIKNTVFAFLSLSTMGYAADGSLTEEDIETLWCYLQHDADGGDAVVYPREQTAPFLRRPSPEFDTEEQESPAMLLDTEDLFALLDTDLADDEESHIETLWCDLQHAADRGDAAVCPQEQTAPLSLLRHLAPELDSEEQESPAMLLDTEDIFALLDADLADDEESHIEQPLPCDLQHAADRSDAEAMHSYAVAMYDNAVMVYRGRGGERDLTEMRNYFHKAADLGHRGAMYEYAVMCNRGRGGEQDLAEARYHYQQAADLGHQSAMFNYACMLENGEGGEQNLAEAMRCYQQAADWGFAPAKRHLAHKQGANIAAQPQIASNRSIGFPLPAATAAAKRPQIANNRPTGFALPAAAVAAEQPQSMRNSGVSAITMLVQVPSEQPLQEKARGPFAKY